MAREVYVTDTVTSAMSDNETIVVITLAFNYKTHNLPLYVVEVVAVRLLCPERS